MKTILVAALLLLFAGVSQADSVWTYTGNATPDPLAFHNPCACALTGSVTFDASWNPLSWDFTDGTHDLNSTNSSGTLRPFFWNTEALPFSTGWEIALNSLDGLWHLGSINYGSQFEQTDFSYGDVGFLNVQGHQGVFSEPVSTPEPGSLLLLGAGLLAAILLKANS